MIRILQAMFSTLQCRLQRGLGSAAVLFAFAGLHQLGSGEYSGEPGGESATQSISALLDRALASVNSSINPSINPLINLSSKPADRITSADWYSPNQLIQSGRCRVILAPA